ncbi:MAG: shikimate dehydrogenase [Phycisphaerae bacterium]|nr:shikimate dehydrogenase [Gemmatimonadaceae bacterium]
MSVERPKRLVLLGHPVSHSLSPVFQDAALKSAALNATYDALDVTAENLPTVLRELARASVAGNVTIPHKEAMAAACVRLTDIAARAGAVNTFWHEKGKLVGDNTDVDGARAAIAYVLQVGQTGGQAPGVSPAIEAGSPLRVAVIGAGGAAAAVIIALESFAPVEITITARTRQRAVALVARLGVTARVVDSATEVVRGAMLVINCTPIGLRDQEFPVAVEALERAARVLDLIPRGGETAWVRECRHQGHVAEDGTRMLVEQGAAAFERWFDMVPDRASMWRALKAHTEGPGAPRVMSTPLHGRTV